MVVVVGKECGTSIVFTGLEGLPGLELGSVPGDVWVLATEVQEEVFHAEEGVAEGEDSGGGNLPGWVDWAKERSALRISLVKGFVAGWSSNSWRLCMARVMAT